MYFEEHKQDFEGLCLDPKYPVPNVNWGVAALLPHNVHVVNLEASDAVTVVDASELKDIGDLTSTLGMEPLPASSSTPPTPTFGPSSTAT